MYSGDLDMPDEVVDVVELFYLAQEYEVTDLMQRCEEEIALKVSPKNVVDVLTKYYPVLVKIAAANKEEDKIDDD